MTHNTCDQLFCIFTVWDGWVGQFNLVTFDAQLVFDWTDGQERFQWVLEPSNMAPIMLLGAFGGVTTNSTDIQDAIV